MILPRYDQGFLETALTTLTGLYPNLLWLDTLQTPAGLG